MSCRSREGQIDSTVLRTPNRRSASSHRIISFLASFDQLSRSAELAWPVYLAENSGAFQTRLGCRGWLHSPWLVAGCTNSIKGTKGELEGQVCGNLLYKPIRMMLAVGGGVSLLVCWGRKNSRKGGSRRDLSTSSSFFLLLKLDYSIFFLLACLLFLSRSIRWFGSTRYSRSSLQYLRRRLYPLLSR